MTKRRVLVIEDNLDSVQSMAFLLKSMGHEVQFAIHGFAALDVARSFKPEVILLDIALPGFNGDEVARRFKDEPGLEDTRIIAITGMPMADVEERALEAGCEHVFAKPIDPLVLEKLLEETE
jgi:CheY-like chemotaxis protein